jgi:segregation and condensation protein B
MDQELLIGSLEAVLFAAGEPITRKELGAIFDRLWAALPEEERSSRGKELEAALGELRTRWQAGGDSRGFVLSDVAEGLSFRTNPRYADALKAMREQRPVRLSRPALETLAIVAYRQPVTKPDIDQIRGVDCSATIKLLLDRSLIRIVGKREEPGLPLLYGTTREFLSFFNLANLAQLPSLREYHELSDDSKEQLDRFDQEVTLESLKETAQRLRPDEEPAVIDLEQAVTGLKHTEKVARTALAEHGVELIDPDQAPAVPGQGTAAAAPAEGVEPAAADAPEPPPPADDGSPPPPENPAP